MTTRTLPTRAKKGEVVVHDCGPLDEVGDPSEWPSGDIWINACQEFAGVPLEDSAPYWQTSARYALISKFGSQLPNMIDQETKRLQFSESEVELVRKRWSELLTTPSGRKDDDGKRGELSELVSTSRSNKRKLQWSLMDCGPGCQFRLHAHPNIELIYCVRGALHEVRMDGEAFHRDYSSNTGDERHPVGPNLQDLKRSWSFNTLNAGQWLVNEAGSIHKSFTATKGSGCILMVLWGGGHADIPPGQGPRRLDIDDAVNTMDEKLSKCEDCTEWQAISETFLPESERTNP